MVHPRVRLNSTGFPVAAMLMVVTMAGCTEQKYQALAGAPDGIAEVLTVSGGEHAQIGHAEGSFLEAVRQPNRVVLVDFWGPHCGPCLHLAPELEAIARQYPDEVSVVKIDVESSKNTELAMFFAIHAIPEIRIFVDGQSAGAIHGYVAASRIDQHLKPALALLDSRSGP